MVHIETAKLLEKIGLDVGFKGSKIEMWQYLRSTAHNYPLPEYILTPYTDNARFALLLTLFHRCFPAYFLACQLRDVLDYRLPAFRHDRFAQS